MVARTNVIGQCKTKQVKLDCSFPMFSKAYFLFLSLLPIGLEFMLCSNRMSFPRLSYLGKEAICKLRSSCSFSRISRDLGIRRISQIQELESRPGEPTKNDKRRASILNSISYFFSLFFTISRFGRTQRLSKSFHFFNC